MSLKNENIDAVISWVDGDDPEHKQRRQEALKKTKLEENHTLPSGFDATRFSDNNEIRYCVMSILKFAPWIRNIYIVTDNQEPDFLTPELKKKHNIFIVDHTEIFESYEWALPTFNTRTIETALWRIPDIAPRFIYFNDDFVITQKVSPEDFFGTNTTILRGSWHSITEYSPFRMKINDFFSLLTKKLFGITRSMHTLLQIRSAQLAGFRKRYFHIPHVPHPIQTNTLRTFFDEHPDHFNQNIQYQFRSTDQFSAIFLASHLDIKHEKAELRNTDHYLMVHGEVDVPILLNQKLKKIKEGRVLFTCIQAMEQFSTSQRKTIEAVFDDLLSDS